MDSFQWLQRSVLKNPWLLQEEEIYTDQGKLWGLTKNLYASEMIMFQQKNIVVSGKIVLPDRPGVLEYDQLVDTEGRVYVIHGIVKERKQTVCFVESVGLSGEVPEQSNEYPVLIIDDTLYCDEVRYNYWRFEDTWIVIDSGQITVIDSSTNSVWQGDFTSFPVTVPPVQNSEGNIIVAIPGSSSSA